jgi:hypothetical protein
LALALTAGAVGATGCGDNGLGSCAKMPDPGGRWTFLLEPLGGDLGVDVTTLDRPATLRAELTVVKPTTSLAFARYVRGSITSEDGALFGRLDIPALERNNGSKTGATLGCDLQINVPVKMDVTDDDSDEGPMRLSLYGRIEAYGMIVGDAERSTVIPVSDPTETPRRFAWTGRQP